MKVNVNAFIAVLLCTVLLEGLWLLSSRDVSEKDIWSPHHIYQSIGGGATYSSSTSSYAPSSSVGVLALSPSRLGAVRTPSYYAPSYATYDGLQSPLIQSSASAVSPISYTASSAQYHSFGGGGAVAGGSSYGAMRSAASQPSAAASLSMPSMPNYAMVARGQNVEVLQGEMAAVSAISSMANTYNMPMRSSFLSQGINLYQIGASEVTYGSGYFSITGRRNIPTNGDENDIWERWLNTLTEGGMFIEEKDGVRYYSERELYAYFIANQDNFPGLTWDEFLAYIYGGQTEHVLVPVGEPWILLLFAVLLVIIQRRRMTKQTSLEVNE